MPTTSLIALGSNCGDRLASLRAAVRALEKLAVGALHVSRVYETAPMYLAEQPTFLNAVVALDSAYGPEEVMAQLLAIEKRLGRVREERFGPRTIDLDLLAHGEAVLDTEFLRLPHPLLHERPFVLYPLCDVMPQWRHPRLRECALVLRDGLVVPRDETPRPLAAKLVEFADAAAAHR